MRLLNLQKQFCSWQKLKTGDSRNFPKKFIDALDRLNYTLETNTLKILFFNDKLKNTLRFISLKISICNLKYSEC